MIEENKTSDFEKLERPIPKGVILLGWAIMDLLAIGTALTLSQILYQPMANLTDIAPLSEATRVSLQRYSFWIAIPLAGILFLLGLWREGRHGDHRLMLWEVTLAMVVYGLLIQTYLHMANLHLRRFFIGFLALTFLIIMTIRFLAHHRLWLGEERSEKLLPFVFKRMAGEIRELAHRRPMTLPLAGAGASMAASVIMVFSGHPKTGEILSNWAYLLFVTGVITDLVNRKKD